MDHDIVKCPVCDGFLDGQELHVDLDIACSSCGLTNRVLDAIVMLGQSSNGELELVIFDVSSPPPPPETGGTDTNQPGYEWDSDALCADIEKFVSAHPKVRSYLTYTAE
jgi:hypothetical protein